MEEKKIVLIVDDRPETLATFINAMKSKDILVRWVETLDEAVSFIKNNTECIAGIVIDLHMPGSSKITKYEKKFNVTINKGQSLGLYIRKKFKNIPYFYFSNVADSYSKPQNLKEGEEELVHSKFDTNTDKFLEICTENFDLPLEDQ